MKKITFIIIGLLSVSSMFSCKKYLDVVPRTQMPKDILFNTEGGFKDALTGVYIQMNNNNAYGGALTQTTIEQITSSWDVTANTTEQQIGLFNFANANVETQLQNIFSQQYKIISSANAILGQIDSKKHIFATPGLYELIKGEALAIRAYCHLDILRLFGPIPTSPNGNMLAYVKTLSNEPNTRITYSAFQTALIEDMNEAETLLKNVDPILLYSIAQLKSPSISSGFNPQDTYFAYRHLRMNYYAVKALQARAYLWFNNPSKAFECAKLIIDAKNTDASAKYTLGTSADITAKDFMLTREHIFGLYDFDMYNKYTLRYSNGALKKGSAATTITAQLYGTTGTDMRESGLWELLTLANASKVYVIKKYQVPATITGTATADVKQIPMLRLSEMYLIAAETAPFAEGVEYFRQFRVARNISQLALPANAGALQLEILKEYRKEFYAEGQGFYAYKRMNSPKASFLFAPSAATVNYLLPLPKSEVL